MVVMDRQDYSNKAHQLLVDSNTYKHNHKDPINKFRNNMAQTLRSSNHMEDLVTLSTYILLVLFPPSSMVYLKYTILAPLGPLFPVGGPSPMGQPRNWPTSSDPWLASPLITSNMQQFVEHIKRVKLEPGMLWHLMVLRHSSPQYPWTPPLP